MDSYFPRSYVQEASVVIYNISTSLKRQYINLFIMGMKILLSKSYESIKTQDWREHELLFFQSSNFLLVLGLNPTTVGSIFCDPTIMSVTKKKKKRN